MGNNSGEKVKKYGSAGTKRGRFNANPTPTNHVSCNIMAKSKKDKADNIKLPRIIKTFVSKSKSSSSVEGT